MELLDYLRSGGTIVGMAVVLFLVDRLLRRGRGATNDFRNQALMLGCSAVALLVIIITLPIDSTMRGQILNLVGLLVTAAIALSSTTFVGNAMAGVMLRAVRHFRIGDFIRTEEYFGRVTERGFFHTEIQTRERDLVTLPNLYLITHPVTTIRSSGTIISAEVSLGYDVPRTTIEKLLIQAARETGLEEPFVQVVELGDFTVNYRINGLLTDVKQLLTVRSKLRAKVLDSLHGGGVEIVSPNFMNQRVYPEDSTFIPEPVKAGPEEEPTTTPEDLVFDKAEEAESVATLKERYAEALDAVAKAEKDKDTEDADLGRLRRRAERIKSIIDKRKADIED